VQLFGFGAGGLELVGDLLLAFLQLDRGGRRPVPAGPSG
jgi:hypothetical protein